MNTIFAILLAGCGHSEGDCTQLERIEIAASDRPACELELDRRMAGLTAEWPVFQGICVEISPRAERLPDWWQADDLVIAQQ